MRGKKIRGGEGEGEGNKYRERGRGRGRGRGRERERKGAMYSTLIPPPPFHLQATDLI